MPQHDGLTLLIVAFSLAGVIVRPWRWPEMLWAMAGAVLLLLTGLMSWRAAADAVMQGTDVYLFLVGMMLLSELARKEGVFDSLAGIAVGAANGSAPRLFLLVYATGTLVTIFMSNDAAAVVLTPAVFAAARAAKAKPLPYLYICAFVANAASFVLPISNPANLVLFQSQMPPLLAWLARFTLPSLASILVTYLILRFTQKDALQDPIARTHDVPALSGTGIIAAWGIALTAAALMLASAFGLKLGWPTFLCSALAALAVLTRKRAAPWGLLKNISWSVLPLVAGLFIMVEALRRAGFTRELEAWLQAYTGTWSEAAGFALACNVMNNLPVGLIAGMFHAPEQLKAALLIGVDLGPNLSVTGSLATILWLTALRREGEHISAFAFLKLGAWLMPLALAASLTALAWQ